MMAEVAIRPRVNAASHVNQRGGRILSLVDLTEAGGEMRDQLFRENCVATVRRAIPHANKETRFARASACSFQVSDVRKEKNRLGIGCPGRYRLWGSTSGVAPPLNLASL